jgi:hypothetical protein
MCELPLGRRLPVMRHFAIFLATMLSACSAVPLGAQAPSRALLIGVPRQAGQASRPCRTSTKVFASTPLADREGWYGQHLRALGERPLCGLAAEVYRLTWVPSFHPTIVVRVEHDSAGYLLRAKRESGAGGYEPGQLAVDTSIRLVKSDVAVLRRLLGAARFWSLPSKPAPDGTVGTDGAQWVMEGLVAGRYHVVDRWSPRAGGPHARYRQLAEWLLIRSGLASRSLVREY